MRVQIKYMGEDGKIRFCCSESWEATEEGCFVEAIRNFRCSYAGKNKILELKDVTAGADRNWNED